MASSTFQLKVSCIVAVVLAFSSVTGPHIAFAAKTFQVELQLDVPNAAVNNFDLGLVLDALFEPYRVVAGNGSVSLGGILRASLALRSDESPAPQVVGLSLQGAPTDLNQSNLLSKFGVPTGSVDLATDSVVGYIESHPDAPMTGVENGEFSREDFRLVLMGGTALVTVPSPKPGKGQKIDEINIVGEFPTTAELIGRVNLTHLAGSQYQVTLGIPMAGLSMTIAKAGLPVDVTFHSGELRATGLFSIPEPATPTLTAIALVAWRAARRRRMGITRVA